MRVSVSETFGPKIKCFRSPGRLLVPALSPALNQSTCAKATEMIKDRQRYCNGRWPVFQRVDSPTEMLALELEVLDRDRTIIPEPMTAQGWSVPDPQIADSRCVLLGEHLAILAFTTSRSWSSDQGSPAATVAATVNGVGLGRPRHSIW
ncbi:hypothetical protein V2G26_003519 [Clonostachys chloroleuca]